MTIAFLVSRLPTSLWPTSNIMHSCCLLRKTGFFDSSFRLALISNPDLSIDQYRPASTMMAHCFYGLAFFLHKHLIYYSSQFLLSTIILKLNHFSIYIQASYISVCYPSLPLPPTLAYTHTNHVAPPRAHSTC